MMMELQVSELDARTREHYRHAEATNRDGWRPPTAVRMEQWITLTTLLAEGRSRLPTRKALCGDIGMAIGLDASVTGDATLEPTR